MARTRGSNKINVWLREQSHELQTEFLNYARTHFHRKPEIQAYLIEKGLQVDISTVYKWTAANVMPGDQAVMFNQSNASFQGVDLVPGMEAMFAKMVLIAKKFVDIVEDAPDIQLEYAINNLPLYCREIRSLSEIIYKVKAAQDQEALVYAGAARLMELVLAAPTVKDKPEEQFIQKTLQAALLRIKEEIKDAERRI